MLLDWLLILLGLALLIAGGEALVRGASGIALLARVSPAVVGLTVVAAGTSMPELVVSVQASIEGNAGIAVGNIVGSNIFNVAAILGITAMIRPLRIQGNTIRLEWPVMMLAAVQFLLLSRDGRIDRLEGGALLAAMVAFTAYVVWLGRSHSTSHDAGFSDLTTANFGRKGSAALAANSAAVIVGIGVLGAGSTALVRGAVNVAGSLGVSETVIGLTIVAAGTSTPELVTSLVAAWRGRDDIAVGNVVGSNIFNVLGIGGIAALIHPLTVPPQIIEIDNWWMVGITALLFPLMKSGLRINRVEGAVLAFFYAAYLALMVQLA